MPAVFCFESKAQGLGQWHEANEPLVIEYLLSMQPGVGGYGRKLTIPQPHRLIRFRRCHVQKHKNSFQL